MKNDSLYRDLVTAAVAIPSVSTDPIYKKDMDRTAEWYRDLFLSKGLTADLFEGFGNLILRASFIHDKSLPTCIIYGHYDVQPAEKSDGWKSDPFVLTEREGALYGRGVSDNKGQAMVHFAALFEAIEAGVLSYNVIVLLEGDEETGKGDLHGFLSAHKELFQADFALISDGMISGKTPLLEVGFRGMTNITVTITTADTDAHSGVYGGILPNAAHVLGQVLGSLYDDENRLQCSTKSYVPEGVSEEDWKGIRSSTVTAQSLREVTGGKGFCVPDGTDITQTVSFSPTVQVTGLQSGYTEIGYRNSIPAKATAKLNIRTAPGQDSGAFLETVYAHLRAHTPAYADIAFEYEGGSEKGFLLPFETPFMDQVKKCLKECYGKEPVLHCCGGTLPIAGHIDEILGIPQFHVPLANEDCGMHAPNENMSLWAIEKGLAFSRKFFGL